MAQQRYGDAVVGWPYTLMIGSFERGIYERSGVANGAKAGASRGPARDLVIAGTAKNIEVLAGSGDLANARTLVQRLLAFDNSESTRALVQKHAARAGQPGLLGSPSNP